MKLEIKFENFACMTAHLLIAEKKTLHMRNWSDVLPKGVLPH
jgi:hypothetical protein